MSYLYPIPANKLQELVGSKIKLAWSKFTSEYTLLRVEGNSIHTEDAFGVKGKFNSKDACYTKALLPKELAR